MKVRSRCLSHLRLDQTYCLLDARGVSVVLELFKAIDIRGEMALDGNYPFVKYLLQHLSSGCCLDIQFLVFMKVVTDLSKDKIYAVFDMLDVDHSGLVDFDEFYLLICILIAVRVSSHPLPLSHPLFLSLSFSQDRQEKEFIYRHSRTVFELLDTDGSNNISGDEFENFGFLFNFESSAVNQIFREFDVSGDQVHSSQ